jgi:molybdopterin-guanine dinucleotide biosynthesis protein A
MATETVMGAVLAGGRGSRLGGAKATVELGGRPLIAYPLDAIERTGLDVVVVAKRDTPLPGLAAPVWYERDEPEHPALGITTVLQRAPTESVLVVGCDMPFVTTELLAHLASLPYPLAMPSAGGRLHPLIGLYARGLATAFAFALGKENSLQQTVAELGPHLIDESELEQFGDPERLLFNVNTPEDLERAREMMENES